MNLLKILNEKSIKLNLEATNKLNALKELIDILEEQNIIEDKNVFLEDVLLREEIGTTGIGDGIAIPHGKSDTVLKTGIVIGRTSTGIDWQALDDEPVFMVILFAVRNDDRETVHVKLLSKVATVLGREEITEEIINAKSEKEIIDLFINNS